MSQRRNHTGNQKYIVPNDKENATYKMCGMQPKFIFRYKINYIYRIKEKNHIILADVKN